MHNDITAFHRGKKDQMEIDYVAFKERRRKSSSLAACSLCYKDTHVNLSIDNCLLLSVAEQKSHGTGGGISKYLVRGKMQEDLTSCDFAFVIFFLSSLCVAKRTEVRELRGRLVSTTV